MACLLFCAHNAGVIEVKRAAETFHSHGIYIFALGPKCWWRALIKEATGQIWLSFPLARASALLLQSQLPAIKIRPRRTLSKTTGQRGRIKPYFALEVLRYDLLTHPCICFVCRQVLDLVWSMCRPLSLSDSTLRDGERWRLESQFAALESALSWWRRSPPISSTTGAGE